MFQSGRECRKGKEEKNEVWGEVWLAVPDSKHMLANVYWTTVVSEEQNDLFPEELQKAHFSPSSIGHS